MDRINVFDYSTEPPERVGSFDADRAQEWSDGDHDGHGSRGPGRGTAVLLTASGRWILQEWTRWQGEEPRHRFITEEEAKEWLTRNNFDEEVRRHFGELEIESGGRPAIDGPNVNLKIPTELLDGIDTYARGENLSRATAMRSLLEAGLRRQRKERP